MEKNLLSVIITSYKREAAIVERAIVSVIAQTYPLIEILLVDDNQDDSSWSSELKKMASTYSEVHYIKQIGNQGACEARNLGIEHSQGEYIGFLDDDDTWEKEKATEQIALFSTNVGLVYCLGKSIVENGSQQEIYPYVNALMFKKEVTFEDMLSADYIGSTSQAIVKKECFEVCGCFDKNLLARQDYEMWIRLTKQFRALGVEKPLFNHYIHPGEQISKNSYKSMQGYEYVYKKYHNEYDKNVFAREKIFYSIAMAAFRVNFKKYIYYRTKNILCKIEIKFKNRG
ncbi:glycosyltransferase family 2 protein [Priestia megaterium]|uniref:glycosyltransferase family 2 protein n=1 Tax=Priestia megaterium TaxID=1404 RepID=UPI0023794178|nr:glycosyltransferase family 2 protein [Priestia megaterium]WDM33082.1 glycosyltransferase family 2 protein [Priestia megaterium]